MCGIYGFFQYEKAKQCKPLDKILERLALSNIQRGMDSTGQAIITQDDKAHFIKKLGDAKYYYQHPKIQEGLRIHFKENPKVVLGHTRAATTGAISLMNAQPFIYENIIGTHNGIIWNYDDVFKSHNLKSLTTCDSEVIFALLSTAVDNSDRSKLLSELSGYLATAYIDIAMPGVIHFASVDNPSLYAFKTPYGIFWSSIKRSLKKTLKQYRVPCQEIDLGINQLVSIQASGIVSRVDIEYIHKINFQPSISTMYGYPYNYHNQKDDLYQICDNCYEVSQHELNYKLVNGYGICKKCEILYWVDDKRYQIKKYGI
jgi:glucosamine 6-phosphate synthetase-like amidotransferase/phosphosugar isomerase protein